MDDGASQLRTLPGVVNADSQPNGCTPARSEIRATMTNAAIHTTATANTLARNE